MNIVTTKSAFIPHRTINYGYRDISKYNINQVMIQTVFCVGFSPPKTF